MRRFLLVLVSILVLLILFRGPLYRSMVQYRVIGERNSLPFTQEARQACLNAMPDSTSIIDIDDAIAFARDLTADSLSYAFTNTSNDPSALLLSGHRAHCVGYAALFTAACNAAIEHGGLHADFRCHQRVAKLYVFGEDVHALFSSPFFKDHDICLIECTITGKTIAVDPTVSDILWINQIALTP